MCYAFKQWSSWYTLWPPLGYLGSYLSDSLVCTWFFVDIYLCDFVYLETYTHERCYILKFTSYSLSLKLVLVCWDDMLCSILIYLKTMLMIIDHSCVSLIIYFAMLLTHNFWLSTFLKCFISSCSTICLVQVIFFISYHFSLAHDLCSK